MARGWLPSVPSWTDFKRVLAKLQYWDAKELTATSVHPWSRTQRFCTMSPQTSGTEAPVAVLEGVGGAYLEGRILMMETGRAWWVIFVQGKKLQLCRGYLWVRMNWDWRATLKGLNRFLLLLNLFAWAQYWRASYLALYTGVRFIILPLFCYV